MSRSRVLRRAGSRALSTHPMRSEAFAPKVAEREHLAPIAARELPVEVEAAAELAAFGDDPSVNPGWPLLHVARPTSPPGPPLRATLGELGRRRR